MKRAAKHGGSLVELLVSLGVASLLLVFMVQVLGGVQRAWTTTRRAAGQKINAQQALPLLCDSISSAVLNVRQRFDLPAHPGQVVTDSDLHFVAGPAAELIPGVPHACGDALFFQRTNAAGLLEACGFYVQFASDKEEKPAALGTLVESRGRFRLMQFHQAANELTLFEPSSGSTGAPFMATFTTRAELYAWFREPLKQEATAAAHTVMVAENVLAMLVREAPDDQRCYDTRRFQWDDASTAAANSRHLLPRSVEVTLLTMDEVGWAHLNPVDLGAASLQLEAFMAAHFQETAQRTADLERLRQLADSLKLQLQVVTSTVNL